MNKLTIIIPVYNEQNTILQILKQVEKKDISPILKEIIVVDDGSSDETVKRVKQSLSLLKHTKLIEHATNLGKGLAVRTGIKHAQGDYLLVQDADLEYNPEDIPRLIYPIQTKKAQVVFGSRLQRLPNLRRDERRFRFLLHYLGNRSLSLLTSLLYGQYLTDIETGYKLFPAKIARKLALTAKGFEFEPEITIQLMREGYTIHEVPIRTNPRGYEKGKKLRTVPDGLKALKMILKLRI